MMRYTMSQLVRLSVVAGSVFLGGTVAVNAANLTNDGDFGLESNNVTIPGSSATSWYGNATYGDTSDSSPFTNAFPVNGKSIRENTGGSYWVQDLTAVTSGVLYANMDFRLNGTGSFVCSIANSAYSNGRSAALYFNNDTAYSKVGVFAEGDQGVFGTSLLIPEIGTWYNVQLTLNLDNDTYSGVITKAGTLEQALISSRPFVAADRAISKIYSDSNVIPMIGITGVGMYHSMDNVVLSTTPMPIPEPGALALSVCGVAGLLASRKQRANKRA